MIVIRGTFATELRTLAPGGAVIPLILYTTCRYVGYVFIYFYNSLGRLLVHTATRQAIQNQNKLTVDCTGTSYNASSGYTSFVKLDVLLCVHRVVSKKEDQIRFYCWLT